jgi:ankyrin repeat protein
MNHDEAGNDEAESEAAAAEAAAVAPAPPEEEQEEAGTETALVLLDAIRQEERLATIQGILNENPGAIQERDADGSNAVHCAACARSPLEVVELLARLRPEALREKTTRDGLTPLHVAAAHASDDEVVEFLIRSRPEALREKDANGNIPFRFAAARGLIGVVQCLAVAWPGALAEKAADGWTALHCAAGLSDANLEVVAYLAAKGTRALHERTAEGFLPLHVAIVRNGSLPVVKFLAREHPASLRAPVTESGQVALHVAACRSNLDIVQWIAKADPGALCKPTRSGWLPLHYAARHSTVEVVQALADAFRGALATRTKAGMLPLHVAALYATFEVVQWLAHKDPHAVEERTACGQFPLHLAATQGNLESVQFLANAFPRALREPAANNGHFLPLHDAARSDAPVDVVYALAKLHPEAIGRSSRHGGDDAGTETGRTFKRRLLL